MRSRSLDGIRGVAILAVMANHTGLPLARGGWLGVDLFFVLSGYLITTILISERERTGRVSLKRFYARRALRLYPALILTCVIALAVPTFVGFGDRTQGLRGVATAATYLQDVAINAGWNTGTGLWHTWTLSIEEQFYLIWPPVLVMIVAIGRANLRWVVVGVLLVGIAYSVCVLILAFEPSTSPTSGVYYRPDARAGALLVGCLVAVGVRLAPLVLPAVVGWIALAVFVGTCAVAPEANTLSAFVFAIPLVWLSSAVLIAELAVSGERALGRILGWRPLALVGLVSYGLYLYHPLIFHAVASHTSLSRHVGSPVAIGLALVAAGLSYRFVEMPFLRIKRRFGSEGAVAVGSRTLGPSLAVTLN